MILDPLQYDSAAAEAAEMFADCIYDVCEELTFERNPDDDVCSYMENYDSLVTENYGTSLPNWRSGGFCGMFSILE